MRRIVSIAVVLLAVGGVFASAPGLRLRSGDVAAVEPVVAAVEEPQAQAKEKKVIDLKADLSGPVSPGDSAIFMVGNFAAQHNGAVITCDSAVRYSADRIEFFGNVLINQNTTYVYGDRAEYDRQKSEARVYSDIVKVVDGDATLYTYNFVFNTQENVGTFRGGGVLYNRDNLLEALRGYYYSNTKELIGVGNVEMRNRDYSMRGDSVIYNLATDHAYFFAHTNIWNSDGDYLYADRGSYAQSDSLYSLTLNGYILTETQELWSDTLDYWRAAGHVVMRNNIQIDDSEYKVLAFGDYGEYWKNPGDALLTRRPSVLNYDASQPDTLYLRADSIWLRTIYALREAARADSLAADSLASEWVSGDSTGRFYVPQQDDTTRRRVAEPMPLQPTSDVSRRSLEPTVHEPSQLPADVSTTLAPRPEVGADSLVMPSSDLRRRRSPEPTVHEPSQLPADVSTTLASRPEGPDSLAMPSADSLTVQDTTMLHPTGDDTLSRAARRARLREAKAQAKAARREEAARLREARLDTIAMQRQAKATAKLLAIKEREEARLAARREKAIQRLRRRQQRALLRGRELPDSSMLFRFDSLIDRNALMQDSLLRVLADSLGADFRLDSTTLQPRIDSTDTLAVADTIYRLVKGYRNVRIFRTDFQAVCDSLTSDSRDSTIHLYIDPVLWNEANQITSEVMDVYTANQQLVRAEFVGDPMMVSEIDTLHYNQVAGKEMVAYFRNNRIYRNDVNGNAQTIYYMQESGSPDVMGLLVVESGNIRFYITEENRIRQITYLNDPNYVIYPMDKIPPEQKLYLEGFHWEAARRPTLEDVFDRRIRPSKRETNEALSRPSFPICRRIERDRMRFATDRGWVDRADVVTPDIAEWMRSLGYTVGEPRKR